MASPFPMSAQDSNRLKALVQIASRFGLGVIMDQIGLPTNRNITADDNPQTLPQRTRATLEALGPGFVKLGQILATRSDLLSPEWVLEFEKLQNQAPTIAFEELRPAVEAALGQAPETAFATFETEPLAAASIAQVHRATTHDGRAVILKIQRPAIRAAMESDLRLITALANIAEKTSAEVRRFEPVNLIRQLAAAILEELDFTHEGRNADLIRSDFAHNPAVVIPDIHWQWTSPTLLVMDYIDGIPPRSSHALEVADISPQAIASLGADIVLEMMLVHGRFHADPHPGNLLCLVGNRIGLIDLGMIGHVSPRRREELISFIRSFIDGDAQRLSEILSDWANQPLSGNSRMTLAAEQLIKQHSAGSLLLSPMISDLLSMMRKERLAVPPDLILIFKALLTIDGVLQTIQPDFDLTHAIKSASLKIISQRLSPNHLTQLVSEIGWEAIQIGHDTPRLIRAAIRRLETETPDTNRTFDQNNNKALRATITSAGRTIALAILIASIIISASLILYS